MLNNIKTKERGFTIVELLIVIVVIAILAAITIVAFSGIQQRSRDSARQADVSNLVKALVAYTSEGNNWPATGAAAATALNGYTTANVDSTVTAKLGTTPTSGAPNTYGYTSCPTGATGSAITGAKLTWWKEQATAGLQTVNAGTLGTC